MQGHLVRMNIRVPRHALRRSIHRVDHENVVSRRHLVVSRCCCKEVYRYPHWRAERASLVKNKNKKAKW